MDSNRPAASENNSNPKRKHKFLTVAEKMALINEGKSHAYIARLFGVGGKIASGIKKVRSRIRKTVKKIISPHHEQPIYMEAAPIIWMLNCRKKNIALNSKIVTTKTLKLYET